MDDITNKWEGTNIIDNTWFAICEKEKRDIVLPNGNLFRFDVLCDNTTLRIYKSSGLNLYVARNITKEEIEKALCYWPNETAIKMLNKGNYIYSILNLCRDVADDIIIAREIG